MNRARRLIPLLFAASMAVAFGACTPPYPKCKEDAHCKDRPSPKTDNLFWCVQGQCVACRDSADCKAGFECKANACVEIPGYCDPAKPCPPGEVCRNNRCGPECNDQFPCPAGQYCKNNKCLEKPVCGPDFPCPPGQECIDGKECRAPKPKCPASCPKGQQCDESTGKCAPIPGWCDSDKDCKPGEVCKDNKCEAKPVAECTPGSIVYFDFDKSDIRDDQKKAIDDNVECLKKKEGAVSVEGHCDERGTREYNIALGERRYQAVINAYKAAGIPESRLSGISHGKEKPTCTEKGEGCWSKNRRAETKFK